MSSRRPLAREGQRASYTTHRMHCTLHHETMPSRPPFGHSRTRYWLSGPRSSPAGRPSGCFAADRRSRKKRSAPLCCGRARRSGSQSSPRPTRAGGGRPAQARGPRRCEPCSFFSSAKGEKRSTRSAAGGDDGIKTNSTSSGLRSFPTLPKSSSICALAIDRRKGDERGWMWCVAQRRTASQNTWRR